MFSLRNFDFSLSQNQPLLEYANTFIVHSNTVLPFTSVPDRFFAFFVEFALMSVLSNYADVLPSDEEEDEEDCACPDVCRPLLFIYLSISYTVCSHRQRRRGRG